MLHGFGWTYEDYARGYILQVWYRKAPKFSDTKCFFCNLPKIQIKKPNLKVFHQNHAKGIANSEDPDQTAPRSSLI